jgi:hypothetical protein
MQSAPGRWGRVREVRLPYLYFSARLWALSLSLVGLAAWLYTGFNIVEGGVPVIGIQWSTFATFSFFFWLLMANFQNGISSFADLKAALKDDIRYLARAARERPHFWRSWITGDGKFADFWARIERRVDVAWISVDWVVREQYPQKGNVKSLGAFTAALLVCMSATFLFEAIWVPLYDYFQFGSVFWPVYFASVMPPVIIRNVGLFIMPLAIVWVLFSIKDWFPVQYRANGQWLGILAVCAGMWLTWIAFPHSAFPISQLDYGTANQVIGPLAKTFNPMDCYIYPSQALFPQNTYTFYPCALAGQSYTPPQILGFFDSDPFVHLVNVLTKFVTFAAVAFPFLVRKIGA